MNGELFNKAIDHCIDLRKARWNDLSFIERDSRKKSLYNKDKVFRAMEVLQKDDPVIDKVMTSLEVLNVDKVLNSKENTHSTLDQLQMNKISRLKLNKR